MAQGLSSLLGGLAQGFTDLGKSTLDVLGGGTTNNVLTAGLDALINKKSYGQAVKDANQRQKDFRKWLYETESDKDAAAKGLGTALNGAQTAIDLIPGLGQSAPVNAIQGAIGGLADEFKFNGENYDWGKGAQRAAVGAGAGLAAGGLGKALANSGSKVLSNGVLKGAATGSLGGALSQAGGTAIEGGNADQILQSAAQGAQFGALLGAGTGGVQSLAGALKKTRAKNSAPAIEIEEDVMAELAPEQVYYHGSPEADITEFDIKRAGKNTGSGEKAIFFTDSPSVADEYSYERKPTDSMFVNEKGKKGKVYRANLKMDNTLDLDNLTDDQIRELWDYATPLGKLNGQEDFIQKMTDWRDKYHNAQLTKGYLDLEALQNSPYDSFSARMYPNTDNTAKEYGVFNKDQISLLPDEEVVMAELAPETTNVYDSVSEPAKGYKRLYRGLTQEYDPNYPTNKLDTSGYESWTDNPELAKQYGKNVYYTDVPETDIKTSYLDENPMSETYGDRNPIYSIDKKAGLNGVSGKEYLLYMDDPYQKNLKYNLLPDEEVMSELAPEQSAIADAMLSPEQKEFFKDSVIREPGGSLKTVYHGTDADFNTFGEIKTEPGYWFTEDKDYAASHGKNLKSVNLNMKNPLDLNTIEGDNKLVKYLRECFGDNASESDIYTKKFRNFLKNKGYDGMIWEHSGKNTYIAFEPNQIKDVNNLTPTDNADIMAERVAPGQLGLFDQTATKAPETGYSQLGLFDTPTKPKTVDVADVNPYAPVNGEVTQTMLDRSAETLKNYKKGIPNNDLYNRIDPETLPSGYKELKKLLENSDSFMKQKIGATDIKKAKPEDIAAYLYPEGTTDYKRVIQDIESGRASKTKYGKALYKSIEERTKSRLAKDAMEKLGEQAELSPEIRRNLSLNNLSDISFRDGYTAAADNAISERLGIAPGNTLKYTGAKDTGRGVLGRYKLKSRNIATVKSGDPEQALSNVAHERLHSFQNEAEKFPGSDRRKGSGYDKEVIDAYNELSDNLRNSRLEWAQMREVGQKLGRRDADLAYYADPNEQEARMLQQYLHDKGYTNAIETALREKMGQPKEFSTDYYPAFDKFFDKLRELSKKGVALPAILAALGLGEYATENQEEDKDNGQQI